MTTVKMFKPEFALKVKSGDKRQTIRPVPKIMPITGSDISCRQWSGKPYRSKQELLASGTITLVRPIKIHADGQFEVAGHMLTWQQQWDFARADGFDTPDKLLKWFSVEHGLPFTGIAISWILK